MQRFDWLRLFQEVRPTFIPYARFRVRSRLSPEECRERLAAATQPQKMLTLFSARTSDDARLIFQGQVSKVGFFICPVDHIGLREYRGPRPSQYQGPEPFWLFGRFKTFYGGTDIVVQVFPDPLAFIVACAFLLGVSIQTLWAWSNSVGQLGFPLMFARVLFVYTLVSLPVSFKAYKFKKALGNLLQ